MPAFFQCFEAYFDHGDTDDLALFFEAVGQVIARLAGRAANAIETPGLTADGILKVSAER